MTSRGLAIAVVAAASLVHAEPGTLKGTITTGSPPTPLAGAVVLVDGPRAPAAPDARHAVVDQRREEFVPHVLAVPVGTTVDFPNHDPVLHNVSSSSPAKRFDLGMYGEGETRSVRFDTPGVVAIRCNVHPRMEAFVVVHDNALAAVTDARGTYTIVDVPAGSHEVRVWHERGAERRVPVTVAAGEVQALDVRLDRTR
jgi:plastocyanin